MTTSLNRLLALTIELQRIVFTAFEQLLDAKVPGSIFCDRIFTEIRHRQLYHDT